VRRWDIYELMCWQVRCVRWVVVIWEIEHWSAIVQHRAELGVEESGSRSVMSDEREQVLNRNHPKRVESDDLGFV
jgi:hypothetical protein